MEHMELIIENKKQIEGLNLSTKTNTYTYPISDWFILKLCQNSIIYHLSFVYFELYKFLLFSKINIEVT